MPDVATPYFRFAPADPIQNVRWRVKIRKAALADKELRAEIRQACFDDPLFFFQFAMWLHEPRARVKTIPFCLWPHQIPAILAIDKLIDESERNMEEPLDLVVDKSRAQGFTYSVLGIVYLRWLRDERFSACLMSRNMEAVDDGTTNSLMGKVDFLVKMTPFWLLPDSFTRSKSKTSYANNDNGAFIIGTAATGDAFSGGRGTLVFFDEVAKFEPGDAEDAMNSTQYVANCRVFGSTHKGDSGVYYDMVYGDAAGVKVVLAWEQNPTQNRLAYRFTEGRFAAERPEEADTVADYVAKIKENGRWEKLRRRGFVKEGKLRSPWYDRQCLRKGATPRGIAQELDRDPRGTVGKVFNPEVMDNMMRDCVKPPVWEGRAMLHDGKLRLIPQKDGPLKLWFKPGLDDAAPDGKYVLAADISTGGGVQTQSNSVLEGGNVRTGEQILEYADPGISPTRLARLAVAIAKWLNNALLIWESQGPTGGRFGNEVQYELEYWNIWLRPKDTSAYTRQPSTRAGWPNNTPHAKAELFDDCWIAMDEKWLVPRSEDWIKENKGWDWDSKKDAKSEAMVYTGTGHGDRSIAGGLMWLGMKDFRKIGLDNQNDDNHSVVKYGTLAWRLEQEKFRPRRYDEAEENGECLGIRELLNVTGD